ncbi:MAG: protein translocase subunit SecD [Planctomycetota bacterium]|jgi:SecD/SecF fusion protein
MKKNLTWKILLIFVFAAAAVLTVYPPHKTLKPGIDLAGGTSLIYEIDAHGLSPEQKKDLSQDTITVLRRRIDPANIQNLVWRPQGNTRFEIQMPLASVEARLKRQNYENIKTRLLDLNINPAVILRSLKKPIEQRNEDFQGFLENSPERKKVLDELARAYDELKELQTKRDSLNKQIQTAEEQLNAKELDLQLIKDSVGRWIALDANDLNDSLKEITDDKENVKLLKKYTETYKQWAQVVEKLIEPETGKNDKYKQAQKQLIRLNLTEDQLELILSMPEKSIKRQDGIKELKSDFPERIKLIDDVVTAYQEYKPFQGRLDDPQDLKRMLKGAGILEFRILPTVGHSDVDSEQMSNYSEALQAKGPKFASDDKYIWCEIEDIKEWKTQNAIVASFGDKYYVLASNKKDEAMTHKVAEKDWKLTNAWATQDRMGLRAIGFSLDDSGGVKFGTITGKNINRPLCIILDDMAISAPNIQERITTQGVITGKFTETERADMVHKLNAGSLPAMINEIPLSENKIGPSIGADNRDKGIKAGIIGFIAVAGCVLIYYTLAGSIADIALFLNMVFVLAIMVVLGATFTLPGIAGIILTIGMNIDANVLIFERIREEQQRGSSLSIAIKNGYQKAFRTIFDANLTTFITAAILFWVASEEIKGFAIVLMIGIASSMFTALFATRVAFDWLLAKGLIRDHLIMLRLIRKPNVNWMALRPVFMTISIILMIAGLLVFFTRNDTKNNKYDIEFTGGTSALIDLKEDMPIEQVREKIRQIAENPDNPIPDLMTANVYSIGKSQKQYEIATTATNKTITSVTFKNTPPATESIISKLNHKLNNLEVKNNNSPNSFIITTSQTSKSLVKDVISKALPDVEVSEPVIDQVVNNAILAAFGDNLQIQQNLKPRIASKEKITAEVIESYPELVDFLGGIKIICDIEKPAKFREIESRFKNLRFKPDVRNINWYNYSILDTNLNPTDPNQTVTSFTYLAAEPEAGIRQLSDNEWQLFVQNETDKIIAAAELETSLPRVTQIAPSIGAEAKTRAMIAIVLSFLAIIAYIWIRFGNVRYGLAAIAALIHDVCITLGAVTACTYIASTSFGQALLIGDFKINLAMIAAFLTLIGYSLNDTIVIFDRIRENRQKAQLKRQTITESINQTISRTVLTSFTTFIVVLVMYIFGGQALRGFTFAIGFGVIIGTYSSIAIAAPLLLIGSRNQAKKK